MPVRYFFLFILTIAFRVRYHDCNEFHSMSSYHEDNSTNIAVYESIMELMHAYKRQHNRHILMLESVESHCQRKFLITNEIDCSNSIGNHYGAFLSDFVTAVIVNRTFILNSESFERVDKSCVNWLNINDWVPVSNVKVFMEDFNQVCHDYNISITEKTTGPSNCNFSNDETVFLTPRVRHHNHAIDLLHYEYNKNMSVLATRNSKILFQKIFEVDSARFYPYGAAHVMLTNFTDNVKQLTMGILRKTLHFENSVRISIHVRHYAMNFNHSDLIKSLDQEKMDALAKLRNSLNPALTCFIYVATEIESSFHRLREFAKTLNCTAYSVDRNNSTIQLNDEFRVFDHGIYGSGVLPYADWYLLQHGDFFVGTYESTFSFLIANEISLLGLKKGISRNTLSWEGSYSENEQSPQIC